jgi:hypothetical protein
MATKRKQGTFARVGQTVSGAARTAMTAADEYVVTPVSSLLGLNGKGSGSRKRSAKKESQPSSAARPAKKKTARKSPARPPKRPTTRTAKTPVKAKPATGARRSAAAKRPAKAKRK